MIICYCFINLCVLHLFSAVEDHPAKKEARVFFWGKVKVGRKKSKCYLIFSLVAPSGIVSFVENLKSPWERKEEREAREERDEKYLEK